MASCFLGHFPMVFHHFTSPHIVVLRVLLSFAHTTENIDLSGIMAKIGDASYSATAAIEPPVAKATQAYPQWCPLKSAVGIAALIFRISNLLTSQFLTPRLTYAGSTEYTN